MDSMKNWYYVNNKTNERVGPVSEAILRGKFAAKEILPKDLVWHDGLPEWVSAKEALSLVEFLPPNVADGALVPLPTGLRGWMCFIGITFILAGLLSIFTIIGWLTGLLAIIAGAGLLSACDALDKMPYIVPAQLEFFQKLARFFRYFGWSVLLSAGVFMLMLFVFSALFAAANLADKFFTFGVVR